MPLAFAKKSKRMRAFGTLNVYELMAMQQIVAIPDPLETKFHLNEGSFC